MKSGPRIQSRETTKGEEAWLYSSSAGYHELLDHPLVLFLGKDNKGLIELNGNKVSALFDTGSAITLVDAKYMDLIVSGQNEGLLSGYAGPTVLR